MGEVLIQGLLMAFTPQSIFWITVGVSLGLFAGVLPGITGGTMMALLMPVMYNMPLSIMTLSIVGIYAAATYGGGITGTLYNIPGEPQGVPTTIEGYRLTLQGRTTEALSIAASSSLFGNTFGVACMLILIPIFIQFLSFFGTAERGLFGLWALVLVAGGVLTREDTVKGILGMGVGLTMGTIGLHINTGTIRYSKAFPILWDGFTPLWLVLGIYAIFQIMLMPRLKDEIEGMRGKIVQRKAESPFEFYGMGIKLIKKHIGMMLKGSVLGTVIGIIPGIGAMTSAWLAYAMAQKTGKERDLVGKGSIEAIACIESANNAAVPGTLIPMFALGIPGNGTAAIIMSLFVMSGVYPGPQMMAQNGDVIWSIVFGIFITGIAFWILAYPFRLAIGYMLKLPIEWMIAIMGPLVLMGCYLAKNSFTGGNIALAVTLLAIFCAYTGINSTGILLGNILCRMIETDLIRAYQLEGFSRYTKPSALIMILVVIATLGFGFFSSYFSKKRKESEGSTIKMVGQSDDAELEFDAAGENIIELSEEEKLLGKEKRKALAENKDAFTRLIAGLAAVALAAAIFAMSGSFAELSKVWPRFVAIAFVLAPGLILLGQAFFNRGKIVRHFTERPKATKKKIRDTAEGWVVFGLMILCFNLGKWIGFIESSTLYALLIMLYFQPKKIKQALYATVTVAVLLVVMKIGFQLLLPVGPLGI